MVLTIWRRPYLQAWPILDRETRTAVADHGIIALVAAVSVLLAFAVSPHAGLLT